MAFLFATVSVSCSPMARINDVTLSEELDTGYRVVRLDGNEPERTRSSIIPVPLIPYVEVTPGTHQIVVQTEDSQSVCESFEFSFAAGTIYRISRADKGLTLVEH